MTVRASRRQAVTHGVLIAAIVGSASLVLVHELVTRRAYEGSLTTIQTVTGNSMPTLLHVAEIRRAVRSVYEEAALDVPDHEELARGSVARWPVIETHLAAYQALPALDEESSMRDDLVTTLHALRRAEARLLAATTEEQRQAILERELLPRTRTTLGILDEIVRENARAAGEAAGAVVLAHARADTLSELLGGLFVVVMVVAGGVAAVTLRRAERATQRHMDELDAFAGRVAHDLKAPLAPALLGCRMLGDEPLPEPARQTLARLDRSLKRASDLVDRLLEFARAGASPTAGARARVTDALAVISPALQQLAIEERATEAAPDLEVGMERVVLASILDNLTRNALLYLGESAERSVRVEARADGGAVLLEVTDTGPGIPQDVLGRLFRPFERGSARPGGSGLGLATVKRLVDGHGGELAVTSRLGVGTTFRVRLPRPDDARPGAG